MHLIRRIKPQISAYAQRFYVKKVNKEMKQVHKEQLLYVKRNAKLTIHSDIEMKIHCADLLQYPDGTALCAELYGGSEKNIGADVKITVSDDEHDVNIVCSQLKDHSECYCMLAVPILADLHIETKAPVSVRNIYNQVLRIQSQKNISTKDVKSTEIELQSEEGNINCAGLLLAQVAGLKTKGRGEITLDKSQGNLLDCETEEGDIRTNSCYSESSRFTTDTGSMYLRNVHKKAQVFIKKQGDLNITGFHGNLYVRSNGGNVNMQLSELSDENVIIIQNVAESIVNISDSIEENSFIEITGSEVILNSLLSHLSDGLSEDKTFFRMSNESSNRNKLMICTKGILNLGKLSWAESTKIAMGAKEQ